MKIRKKIITGFVLSLLSLPVIAQTSLNEFLLMVDKNNPKIISASRGFDVNREELRMGRNPLDPELEYSATFADKTEHELTIRQVFDFPTVYRQRNNVSKYSIQKAELDYLAIRREVLSTACELYVNAISLTRRVNILQKRVENNSILDKYFEKQLKNGQTTILERNKIKTLLLNTRSELRIVNTELANVLSQLKTMSGGVDVNIGTLKYPDFTSVEDAVMIDRVIDNSYAMRSASIDTLINKSQFKLAKQSWIPGFSVGYKAKFDDGNMFSGIVAGISIPLWQNRGNVRTAKLQNKYIDANKADVYMTIKTELNNLYTSYLNYKSISEEYNKYISDNNTELLLIRSLEEGAITITEYLVELTLWYDTIDLAYDAEKSLYITKAQMTKFLN